MIDSYPIYLDYSATTPVDERVVQAMLPWLSQKFGNPASRTHAWGWDAEEAVEQARAQVAALIGADAREIIWTSGATEADNLAIAGAARFHAARGKHIITAATEHKAVLDVCHDLQRQGFEVTVLAVDSSGLVAPESLRAALRPDTILASIMLVNNETGVIQDIAALAAICRAQGVLFHTDATQATGKIAIDVNALGVDLLSMSAHKTYGPKGVGALYVRRKPRVRLEALIHGGGHERGLRSGTLPVHQIVGMGAAYQIAAAALASEPQAIGRLRDRLWESLADLPGIYLNGAAQARVGHTLNFSVAYVEGEALLMSLPQLALSSGSACTSASMEPSHVLRAMGRSDVLAHSSLRVSLGRFTTAAEIQTASGLLREQILRLRALSPLWELSQQNRLGAWREFCA